jgi:hypothetical protein
MVKKFLIILTVLFSSQMSYSQLKSITAFSNYSSALTKRLDVKSANAVGGGVNVEFDLGKNFSLNIEGGYKLFSVSQNNQLLGWGWDFWNNRYSNKIKSDLQADKNLSVEINSSQKLGIIPVVLSVKYSLPISSKFDLNGTVGSGAYFYTRSMFVIENWSKKFPSENYTFQYSYRNFAPVKKGNPFVAKAGLELSYAILDGFKLNLAGEYSQIINTDSKFGFNNFLYLNEFSTKLGIIFSY